MKPMIVEPVDSGSLEFSAKTESQIQLIFMFIQRMKQSLSQTAATVLPLERASMTGRSVWDFLLVH